MFKIEEPSVFDATVLWFATAKSLVFQEDKMFNLFFEILSLASLGWRSKFTGHDNVLAHNSEVNTRILIQFLIAAFRLAYFVFVVICRGLEKNVQQNNYHYKKAITSNAAKADVYI